MADCSFIIFRGLIPAYASGQDGGHRKLRVEGSYNIAFIIVFGILFCYQMYLGYIGRAFSPDQVGNTRAQAAGLGWYNYGPSALKSCASLDWVLNA